MVANLFGVELKNKLLTGIQKLNNSVKSTLGPGGRTVLIQDTMTGIKVTKDGVTVAKAFTEISDPVENIGAQLVKEVALKCSNESGDGTTTATVLASTIVEYGMKLINQGSNPVEIKRELDRYGAKIVEKLKTLSKDITTEEEIASVASISGNNDKEIGLLISTALNKVGKDGLVTIEESKNGETILDIVEGIQFDSGYKSPFFVTNNDMMMAILEEPYILMYDGKITTAAEIVPLLNKVSQESKSLLIIAEDIDGEALSTLVVNKARGIIKACAVKAPDFGQKRLFALEDIAIITGGQVLSKEKGHKLDKFVEWDKALGTAKTVTVQKGKTIVVDGKGTKDSIANRIEELKHQYDNKDISMYEKEKLQERIGKLLGGVCVVYVGGNSDIEIKEKKDRVEDALFATKAALDEGIIPGGGVSLINAYNLVYQPQVVGGVQVATYTQSEFQALAILRKACWAPLLQIADNSAVDEIMHYYYDKLSKSSELTYNCKTREVVNAFENGLIDPTKVTRIAFENALSVAGTILTTESVVYPEKDKDKPANPYEGMM
jgi:chaperonin GroEL